MSIVLAVAEGEVFANDAEIQKSALQVVINCVCAPDKRMSSIGKFIAGSPRRRLPQQTKASESVLTKMWNVVQSNNGIKVESNNYNRQNQCVVFKGNTNKVVWCQNGILGRVGYIMKLQIHCKTQPQTHCSLNGVELMFVH